MTNERPLIELIFDRLAADAVPDETAEVILAALSGDDELADALAGRPPQLDTQRATGGQTRDAIYLSSVTVAGFRGVGPQRTLSIEPGPGLTLIVGRNGSGKSSFAEAIELALTGDSARWSGRTKVWQDGWRNLHAPDPCAIAVELRVDGKATPIRVRHAWPSGAERNAAKTMVTSGDGRFDSLDGLGLARPLELYRPFLSAAEVDKLLSGAQSEMFDALYKILGLEALTAADQRLRNLRSEINDTIKEVRRRRETLRDVLVDIGDERAKRAAAVLDARDPDLDQLDAILAEPLDPAADVEVARCQQLVSMPLPHPDEMARLADELRAACAEAQRYDEARSQASLRTAELLRLALEHHAEDGDGPCPVCAEGRLDAAWRERATKALDELRVRTVTAKRAVDRRNDLIRQIRAMISRISVPDDAPESVPLAPLRTAVSMLRELPSAPHDLADHVVRQYPEVARTAEAAREQALAWLRQRDSGWQRAADEVRAWVEAARQLPEQKRRLKTLTAARDWLKTTGDEIRNDRLAPFSDHARRIWQELRQESSVQLGVMTLTGTGTQRRVKFPVSVDGVEDAALGVMSQGELHALGLAVFLPRACAPESPFRFVVIDDPVQSMDPAKVDGLARVLGDLATDRQVIVFTHDNRLPEALRRLEVDADVLEVVRAERSVVTLRPSSDPVRRYLDDAMAVALSAEVPADVRAPVVAELCRSALEAACQRKVWRVRVARGVPHAEIEAALQAANRLTVTFALALFDDAERGSEVLPTLNRRYGGWAGDAFQACRSGVHEVYRGDLPRLVKHVRRLAEALK
mgnify:CR=1 FL=1